MCSIFDGILDNSYWQISTNKVILGGREGTLQCNESTKQKEELKGAKST